MHEIFKSKNSPHCNNPKCNSLFSSPPVKSVYEETQSLSFFKTKNVGYITRYKDMPDLNSLKVALKKWKPVNFPCKIFKVYQGYRIS